MNLIISVGKTSQSLTESGLWSAKRHADVAVARGSENKSGRDEHPLLCQNSVGESLGALLTVGNTPPQE